jgi:hypothetical protein
MVNNCPQKVDHDPIEIFCHYLVKDEIPSNFLEGSMTRLSNSPLLRAELFECRSAHSQNSQLLRGEFFECREMSNNNTSNLSHGRPPFLNPLGRGEARVFARLARSDSGFPSCYAWFRNGVPPRRDSGFEGGADTRTKPNKNWCFWSENIQRKFEGIRSSSELWRHLNYQSLIKE